MNFSITVPHNHINYKTTHRVLAAQSYCYTTGSTSLCMFYIRCKLGQGQHNHKTRNPKSVSLVSLNILKLWNKVIQTFLKFLLKIQFKTYFTGNAGKEFKMQMKSINIQNVSGEKLTIIN